MLNGLVWASSVFLGASLLVHVTTLFGTVPPPALHVWTLHAACVGTFLLVAAAGARVKLPSSPGAGAYQRRLEALALLIDHSPRWLLMAAWAVFPYAAINFVHCGVRSDRAIPAIVEGVPALVNHGKVVRFLTPDEFEAQKAYALRSASGHWILVFTICLTVALAYSRAQAATRMDAKPGAPAAGGERET